MDLGGGSYVQDMDTTGTDIGITFIHIYFYVYIHINIYIFIFRIQCIHKYLFKYLQVPVCK